MKNRLHNPENSETRENSSTFFGSRQARNASVVPCRTAHPCQLQVSASGTATPTIRQALNLPLPGFASHCFPELFLLSTPAAMLRPVQEGAAHTRSYTKIHIDLHKNTHEIHVNTRKYTRNTRPKLASFKTETIHHQSLRSHRHTKNALHGIHASSCPRFPIRLALRRRVAHASRSPSSDADKSILGRTGALACPIRAPRPNTRPETRECSEALGCVGPAENCRHFRPAVSTAP